MTHSAAFPHRTTGMGALAAFGALTFAITWGVIGAYIIWPDAMAARFGASSGSHPA